ncbi:hypothetical protein [Deinococcus maricopensis]|uniref:Uncharacterized protein n=1 Tax=Deinococcus maricopensis (strain DSM 21211 / LMG 22137 / NRRL B-23946 / LB-34) TaxID=709986 RepID=E8U3C9_DEIML|nr:hypothetical protein [Deinococcus maricopensis]ADV65800.1 hypothetical protein Deima_0136 [Deinococcus maricopensis DSM 21211]
MSQPNEAPSPAAHDPIQMMATLGQRDGRQALLLANLLLYPEQLQEAPSEESSYSRKLQVAGAAILYAVNSKEPTVAQARHLLDIMPEKLAPMVRARLPEQARSLYAVVLKLPTEELAPLAREVAADLLKAMEDGLGERAMKTMRRLAQPDAQD